MRNLTIGSIGENELLELAETIKLKNKLIAERKTIASNIKEKGRASCFISFFAHGFSRDLCDEQGDDTVGQILQAASNNESEFILDKVYDSAISDLEAAISEYTVEQNSLIERDIAKELLEVDLSSELTGSDLCRAMLERGDNYIMCVVGALRALVIIDTLQDGKFYSFGAMYENPIPINNQGEPLTAADVGL
ncbi:hypothetical protein Q6344_09350 [Psychrobacter cibarius]|nr:hypothetical protein Q6344_09350 [Psychrobacter cibarius]